MYRRSFNLQFSLYHHNLHFDWHLIATVITEPSFPHCIQEPIIPLLPNRSDGSGLNVLIVLECVQQVSYTLNAFIRITGVSNSAVANYIVNDLVIVINEKIHAGEQLRTMTPPFLTSRFASTKYAVLDGLSASMNTRSNGSGSGWSVRSESIAGPRMTETLSARPAASMFSFAA